VSEDVVGKAVRLYRGGNRVRVTLEWSGVYCDGDDCYAIQRLVVEANGAAVYADIERIHGVVDSRLSELYEELVNRLADVASEAALKALSRHVGRRLTWSQVYADDSSVCVYEEQRAVCAVYAAVEYFEAIGIRRTSVEFHEPVVEEYEVPG